MLKYNRISGYPIYSIFLNEVFSMGYEVDERYLKKVKDFQPELLPKPKKKIPEGFLIVVDTGEGEHDF